MIVAHGTRTPPVCNDSGNVPRPECSRNFVEVSGASFLYNCVHAVVLIARACVHLYGNQRACVGTAVTGIHRRVRACILVRVVITRGCVHAVVASARRCTLVRVVIARECVYAAVASAYDCMHAVVYNVLECVHAMVPDTPECVQAVVSLMFCTSN
jgi:hypothetical protein